MDAMVEILYTMHELSNEGGLVLVPPYLFHKYTGNFTAEETHVIMGKLHIYPYKMLEDRSEVIYWDKATTTPVKMDAKTAKILYDASMEASIEWDEEPVSDIKITEFQIKVLGYLMSEEHWSEKSQGKESANIKRSLRALSKKDLVVHDGEDWQITNRGLWAWQHAQSEQPIWKPGSVLEAKKSIQIGTETIHKGARAVVVRRNFDMEPRVQVYVCFTSQGEEEENSQQGLPWYNGEDLRPHKKHFKVIKQLDMEPVIGDPDEVQAFVMDY